MQSQLLGLDTSPQSYIQPSDQGLVTLSTERTTQGAMSYRISSLGGCWSSRRMLKKDVNADRDEQRGLGRIPSVFWSGILQLLAVGLLGSCLQAGSALLCMVQPCLYWLSAPGPVA